MERRKQLSDKAKRTRLRMGWTQGEVAERAGISQQCVAKYELGHGIRLDSFLAIWDALFNDWTITEWSK